MERYISFVLMAFLAIGCAREPLPESEQEEQQEKVQAIVPGQAVVQFDDSMIELIEADLQSGSLVTKSSELNSMKEILGISSMERVFSHGGEFEARRRAFGLHRWYKLTFDPEVPVTKASSDLGSVPGIVSVEPVRNIRRTSTFNDPRLKYQWHYKNDGSLNDSHKAGADVNVQPVWENYTTGNPDVIVAVVDGGIDFQHEDLKANCLVKDSKSFVKEQTKVVPHSHGTHVAGTIAAVNNNGIGVAGLAGGDAAAKVPGVKLLSCQIFAPNPDDPQKDFGGSGSEAIVWGADRGAVISQNSWGYVYETKEEAAKASIEGTALADAIDYFIANAGKDANGNQTGPMAGGIVIFAAGNSGWPNDPICEYDPVLAVGSIAPDFSRASYSNYGDWVDIAAPGGSADYAQGEVLSTIPDNGYGYMQGTSMACPHVSGVAALVVSHHGGPGFTAAKLREKLIKGANSSVMSKNAKIGPLVDAMGAMTYGGKTPPVMVTEAVASVLSNNVNLKWKVTSDPDDNKAWGYRVIVSRNKDAFAALNPASVPSDMKCADVLTGSLKVGDDMTGTVPELEFETEYHVAVAAFDYRRNYSALSPVYKVTTEGNNPPEVTTDYDGDFKVKSHEVLEVAYVIADPDGHKITYEYEQGSKADSLKLANDGRYVFKVTGNADEPGEYKATIKVTDSYGLSYTHDIEYEILENHAPVIVKDVEDFFFDQEGLRFSLDMSDYLDDPDGEQLAFEIRMTNKSILHINQADNVLHATTLMFGTTDVTIVAKDSRGLTCTLPFKVVVKDPEKPLEVYPNPVVDWLNISTLDVEPTRISILSSTGRTVYEATMDVGAVEPARIDMSQFAPGVYNLSVSFSGNEYRRTIVKL